jgi:hypothetical protein
MSFDADTLYRLLPALYRIRDSEQGEPLKALIQVIAREVAVLEADLDQLYDDQFIETCAEWVIPYIGDLIGDRPIYTDLPKVLSSRAVVANTIGYRRRKGTPAMLEQLARDVTGWAARVVEFFELLSTTQYMNHLRPHNLATPDLRRWQPLEYLGSPFETTAHTAEMRRIPPRRGRYNIPNIGIFLWRLEAYRISPPGTARAVATPADGRYTFHPVGLNAPLFNPPLRETLFTLAEPIHVPEPLRRRVLYEELEALRQAIAHNQPPQLLYFHQTEDPLTNRIIRSPVFEILVDDSPEPIPPAEILICNLTDWRQPPTEKAYVPTSIDPAAPDPEPIVLPIQVAVDPLLGRIAFPEGVVPERVRVSYSYGFSADVGGGSYDRSESVFPLLERPVDWQVGVSRDADPTDPDLVTNLNAAIIQWNSQPAGTFGIIALLDSQTYAETFQPIEIPEGSQLLIVAAGWNPVEVPDSPTPQRQVGQVSPEFLRPHLLVDLTVVGTAPAGSDDPGNLILDGLLIEGSLTVASGILRTLRLAHCTLVPFTTSFPTPVSLIVEADNALLRLSLDRAIAGPIQINGEITQLQLVTSLIDAGAKVNLAEAEAEEEEEEQTLAIAAFDVPTDIQTSTILGRSEIRSIEASNSIFTETLTVERRQEGCVRFSSLPLNSQAPRRYRCQPNLALEELAKQLNLNTIADPVQQAHIERRLSPDFTSRRYGDPTYGQLSQRCAIEIRQGADDEAEMGVFHDLYQPQRETNLRVRLDEYLRFSLEAGIFYST